MRKSRKMEFPFYGEDDSIKEIREKKDRYIIEKYDGAKGTRKDFADEIILKSAWNDEIVRNKLENQVRKIASLDADSFLLKRLIRFQGKYGDVDFKRLRGFSHSLTFAALLGLLLFVTPLMGLRFAGFVLALGSAVLDVMVIRILNEKKELEKYRRVMDINSSYNNYLDSSNRGERRRPIMSDYMSKNNSLSKKNVKRRILKRDYTK